MKATYVTILALWYIVSSPIADLIRRIRRQGTPRYLYKHGDYFVFEDTEEF